KTELGVHPTKTLNNSTGYNKLKTDSSHQGVGKSLSHDALDKIKTILEDNPNLLPKIHKQQTTLKWRHNLISERKIQCQSLKRFRKIILGLRYPITRSLTKSGSHSKRRPNHHLPYTRNKVPLN